MTQGRSARAIQFAIALACAACGAARESAVEPKAPRTGGAHFQIVRALAAQGRADLVARFRARNGRWSIMLGDGGTPDDIDPLRAVVRRATREESAAAPAAVIDDAALVAEAAAFLTTNADLLGFLPEDVAALALDPGPAKTATYGRWVVHATGKSPMRGYEGFESLTSSIDVLLYLGEDGHPRYFVNLSHVQRRLTLDTAPDLGPDDPRVFARVLGRLLYVAFADPSRPNARVRELRRVSLGPAVAADVRAVRLTIFVSPGPHGAYLSYALAYAIDVEKQGTAFRFVVDADVGTLLEDAAVAVVTEDALSR